MRPDVQIDAHLRAELRHVLEQHAASSWAEDLYRCAPRAMHLLSDLQGRSFSDQVAGVRAILREHCLVGAGGSARFRDEADVDRHAELLLWALDQVGETAVQAGSSHRTPVPPQMFG